MSAPPVATIALKTIAEETARLAGVELAGLRSLSRLRRLAWPRQRGMWAARRLRPDASLTQIARVFGREDHTTVLCAVAAVERRRRSHLIEAPWCDALLAALDPTPTSDPTHSPGDDMSLATLEQRDALDRYRRALAAGEDRALLRRELLAAVGALLAARQPEFAAAAMTAARLIFPDLLPDTDEVGRARSH